jgi:hypothetical protein
MASIVSTCTAVSSSYWRLRPSIRRCSDSTRGHAMRADASGSASCLIRWRDRPLSSEVDCTASLWGGGLRAEPDAAELHNGVAWSAAGRTLFLSHSDARKIFVFDYDVDSGRLGNRRVFASIPAELGIPDGAAIDVDGAYWCALHGRQAQTSSRRWSVGPRHRSAGQPTNNVRVRG